jgi:hypothetical protein
MTKITLKIKIKNMNSVFYFLYRIMKYIVPFYFRLEDYISDTQIILTIFSWPWKKLEFQRLVYGYYYNSHSLNLHFKKKAAFCIIFIRFVFLSPGLIPIWDNHVYIVLLQ